MTKKQSPRTAKLQSIWLAAKTSPVVINCGTGAQAVLLRFQLYNAVKPIRENPVLNPELAEAIEAAQISLSGENKEILTVGLSQISILLDKTLEQLGIVGLPQMPDEIDLEAKASEERMRKLLEGGNLEEAMSPRSNPYNTRG